jgi:hypothetical protein
VRQFLGLLVILCLGCVPAASQRSAIIGRAESWAAEPPISAGLLNDP